MEDHKGLLSAIRNPLSIIAIFVFFVEAVVCFALKIDSLSVGQRTWLVVFCTVFPFLVLVFFFIAVWFRPQNLFGPLDYDNPSLYLDSLKKDKVYKEVKEIEEETNQQNLTTSSRRQITNRIIAAEKLAFWELQKEFDSAVVTNVSLSGHFVFDGFIITNSETIAVEVKYLSNSTNARMILKRIDAFMANSSVFNGRLLAIVSESPISEEDKQFIRARVSDLKPAVQLRFYTL